MNSSTITSGSGDVGLQSTVVPSPSPSISPSKPLIINSAPIPENSSTLADTLNVKWAKINDVPLYSQSEQPQPRHGHRAVAYGHFMIIFGGGNECIMDKLHVFDTLSHSWFQPEIKGQIPPGRAAHGLALDGNRILLFGGMLEYGHYSNDLYELNPAKWEWKKMKPKGPRNGNPPSPRLGHSFTVIKDQVFLFGGLGNETGDPSRLLPHFLNDMYILQVRLNNDNGVWDIPTTFGTPPGPRESHTAIAHFSKDNVFKKLIIYGGTSFGIRMGDLYVLDVDTLMWCKPDVAGAIPSPRSLHAAALVGDKMYVFGGWIPKHVKELKIDDSAWKTTNSLACLNVNTFSWENVHGDVCDENVPKGRAGHSAAVINTRVYIWSGRDGYRRTKHSPAQVCFEDLWQLEVEKPGDPGKVKLLRAATNWLEVSWDAVPGANSYILQCVAYEVPSDPICQPEPAPVPVTPAPAPLTHAPVVPAKSVCAVLPKAVQRKTSVAPTSVAVPPSFPVPHPNTIKWISTPGAGFCTPHKPNIFASNQPLLGLQPRAPGSGARPTYVISKSLSTTTSRMPLQGSQFVVTQASGIRCIQNMSQLTLGINQYSFPAPPAKGQQQPVRMIVVKPGNAGPVKFIPGLVPKIATAKPQYVKYVTSNGQIMTLPQGLLQSVRHQISIDGKPVTVQQTGGQKLFLSNSSGQLVPAGVDTSKTNFMVMGTGTGMKTTVSSTPMKIEVGNAIKTDGMRVILSGNGDPSPDEPEKGGLKGGSMYGPWSSFYFNESWMQLKGGTLELNQETIPIYSVNTKFSWRRAFHGLKGGGDGRGETPDTSNTSGKNAPDEPTHVLMSVDQLPPEPVIPVDPSIVKMEIEAAAFIPTEAPPDADDIKPIVDPITTNTFTFNPDMPSPITAVDVQPFQKRPNQSTLMSLTGQSSVSVNATPSQPTLVRPPVPNSIFDTLPEAQVQSSAALPPINESLSLKSQETTVKKAQMLESEKKEDIWMDVAHTKNTKCVFLHYFNTNEQLSSLEPDTPVDKDLELMKKKLLLKPGSAYKFRVAGINSCGRGPWGEVTAFKTSHHGVPGAPSSVKISTSSEGATITWEPPYTTLGDILEYSVYLVVKPVHAPEPKPKPGVTNLSFVRVYCGESNKCTVSTLSLDQALVNTSAKPAIIFRIAAKNDKGYGPATQVRWLQDSSPQAPTPKTGILKRTGPTATTASMLAIKRGKLDS